MRPYRLTAATRGSFRLIPSQRRQWPQKCVHTFEWMQLHQFHKYHKYHSDIRKVADGNGRTLLLNDQARSSGLWKYRRARLHVILLLYFYFNIAVSYRSSVLVGLQWFGTKSNWAKPMCRSVRLVVVSRNQTQRSD